MGEEFYDQYPWNWEWNFNWLYGINDGSNFEILASESDHRYFDNTEATKEAKQKFREWISEREKIPLDQVELHKFTPPKPINEVAAYFWQKIAREEAAQQFEAKRDLNENIKVKKE